jgi:hypothetical protein
MFIPFHLLKLTSGILLYSLFFSPSHLEGNTDGNHGPCAHICTRRGEFCQVFIFVKLICQTVGAQLFLFLPNLDGCQVGLQLLHITFIISCHIKHYLYKALFIYANLKGPWCRLEGGWIGVTTKLNFFSPNTWADSAPPVRPVVMTGQTGQALVFTGDTGQTGAPHRSDRCSTENLQK